MAGIALGRIAFGYTSYMNWPLKRFTRFNAFQPPAAPRPFYRDGTRGSGAASNGGKDVPPDWLLNLKKQPRLVA